ncbi:aldo/keto reductase [Brachybacterium paraconglomeratum]|uniref:aldo/keto reductase n=1 Tax=Brachybacterium paraconglomeratum TaxID=173362 RepID=UPI003FD5548D
MRAEVRVRSSSGTSTSIPSYPASPARPHSTLKSPIAQGLLAGAEGEVARIAQDRDVTTAQLSLAWLLRKSPNIVPIPGTSSIEHLEENLAAAALQLSADEIDTLSDLGVRIAHECDVPEGA